MNYEPYDWNSMLPKMTETRDVVCAMFNLFTEHFLWKGLPAVSQNRSRESKNAYFAGWNDSMRLCTEVSRKCDPQMAIRFFEQCEQEIHAHFMAQRRQV